MEIKKIKIATEGWDEKDVENISSVFPSSFNIERKKLSQFSAGLDLAILFVVIVGGKIFGGFLESIGSDVWSNIKNRLSQRAEEGKNSTISFEFRNDVSIAKLNLKTEDPVLIKRAFETIDNALGQIKSDEVSPMLYFDNDQKIWIKIKEREFSKTISGIMASTIPIKKGDKIVQFSISQLKEIASQIVNSPFTLGHGGKQIGRVTKAWVEGNELKYEAGIYEGLTSEDEKELNDISQTGGVSMGFSHEF
ncbi:MAG: hypothetical protein LV477_03480 [Candidatus Nitrosotalea sp.]|nr:hypothetical protein [Candidatus Nitrosotalea sp.]